MKVFVSWSGELSQKVAALLKTYIPCIIQSVEVFYSPEDIEKGENWDAKISHELEEANYGIICLTPQNKAAQWINFEAGAIAKSLDSRVAALMININPSDIKGPLSRYQATKMERDDFYRLIQSINNASDSSLPDNILSGTFDGLWERFKNDYDNLLEQFKDTVTPPATPVTPQIEILEEILQLVRKQSTILANSDETLGIPTSFVIPLVVRLNTVIDNIIEYNSVYFRLNQSKVPKEFQNTRKDLRLQPYDLKEIFSILMNFINQTNNIQLRRMVSSTRHKYRRTLLKMDYSYAEPNIEFISSPDMPLSSKEPEDPDLPNE